MRGTQRKRKAAGSGNGRVPAAAGPTTGKKSNARIVAGQVLAHVRDQDLENVAAHLMPGHTVNLRPEDAGLVRARMTAAMVSSLGTLIGRGRL